MLLWVSLLALASVRGQFGTAPDTVISLQPPWPVTFQGQEVTLTCHGPSSEPPGQTTWFHLHQDNKTSRQTPGSTWVVRESGQYRCQAGAARPSAPVHVTFSTASLILQAPPAVFEGDTVPLRCRGKVDSELRDKTLYRNGQVLAQLGGRSDFHIHGAALRDNGTYHCSAQRQAADSVASNTVEIHVQELFPRPVLTASPAQPVEGDPVTLTCETRLPPQRSDVRLRFCFFRDDQPLGSGWSWSPELQVPTVRREDSGSYWCQAETVTQSVTKTSQSTHIPVQRVTANVQVHTRPAPGLVFEGQELVLTCSVTGVRGPVTISWYKRPWSWRVPRIKASGTAELRIATVGGSDAGEYHCVARTGHRSCPSPPVAISVKVPASRPVLTLSPPGARALEGDVVTFHCRAQRGSAPIHYQFFHGGALVRQVEATSSRGASFSASLTAEHSGSYHCTADNGLGPQPSEAQSLSVKVPASRPVLTLSPPGARALEGDVVTLHCEARRGSSYILYKFYCEDVTLGQRSAPSGAGASFRLALREEPCAGFSCTADNGFGPQRSEAVSLRVTVPASRPVLTVAAPGARAVPGDVLRLCCEAPRGSPPILYRFYRGDVALGSSPAPSGGGASLNLSVTEEHSGNYSCEADNGLGPRRSEAVTLRVTVPASRPVLTVAAPGARAVPGDVVRLRCEAPRGSPPILYRFYRGDVALGSSPAPSGGGASLNLSVTEEHSGNYSCEADNGLGPRRSEAVTLRVTGLPRSRSGSAATGVTGVLVGMAGLAALALLFYRWLPRKEGERPAADAPRGPSGADPQEPTYHNVPAWLELQPVSSNAPPAHAEDVVYAEVQVQQGPEQLRHTAATAPAPAPDMGASAIYSQVKAAPARASRPRPLAHSAPHR